MAMVAPAMVRAAEVGQLAVMAVVDVEVVVGKEGESVLLRLGGYIC